MKSRWRIIGTFMEGQEPQHDEVPRTEQEIKEVVKNNNGRWKPALANQYFPPPSWKSTPEKYVLTGLNHYDPLRSDIPGIRYGRWNS